MMNAPDSSEKICCAQNSYASQRMSDAATVNRGGNHGCKMTQASRSLGVQGEALARQYLSERGYEILGSNWSTRYGEIDIIARLNAVIIFVEVKTRQDWNTESAFASITRAKRARLLKAIYQYLHEHNLDEARWRLDAIGIAWQRRGPPIIDHIEDAFGW